jgi:hypothetical protein
MELINVRLRNTANNVPCMVALGPRLVCASRKLIANERGLLRLILYEDPGFFCGGERSNPGSSFARCRL